jgi:rod shape-determining protein MreC
VATSRRNTSQRLTLVILLLASTTFITLDYRGEARHAITSVRNGAGDALSPVQQVIAAGLHPIGNLFSGAVNYGDALNENQRLQREVGQLRQRLYGSQTAENQLRQLLSELHLPFAAGIRQVLGQVIAGPASNFEMTIEIDKGTADGVGVGMPAVSGAGLIGSVISASAHTSVVRLITDSGSQIGVRFPDGTVAVANGQGRGDPLVAQFLSGTAGPTRGNVAFTSGLEGAAFPSGVPLGTVTAVRHSGGAVTSQADIVPIVNFSTLQYVAVLQWLPPA